MRTRGFLLLPCFLVEDQLLAPLAVERRKPAAIELQLLVVEVKNMRDRSVEQVAVMANQNYGVRIFREIILKPQRAFEVEIVGRFVEQQQIRFDKEKGRERNAHAPAARE